MNEFVIYTVRTGGYDDILQPKVVDNRFDYVLFTDHTDASTIGIWQVKTIPYFHADSTRMSRYPKMHPNELLKEYKASLYIDANIQILQQRLYDRIIELYDQQIDWAGAAHPCHRDCIYDEIYAFYGLDYEKTLMRWGHRLRKENFPRHQGLYENNIIFRRHNQMTKAINDLWWQTYDAYSRRDQLSLFYAFWKIPGAKKTLLLSEGENARNSDALKVFNHLSIAKSANRREVKVSFFEHARNRCRHGLSEKEASFRAFHYWLYGLPPFIANLLLYIWGMYSLIVYGPTIKYRAYKRHKRIKNTTTS